MALVGILCFLFAFIFVGFIWSNGSYRMKFLSVLLPCLMIASGYSWFLNGLRLKENSQIYFIKNRVGNYASFSDKELAKALVIESEKENNNAFKMNLAATVYILSVIGLVAEVVIINHTTLVRPKD